MEICLTVSDVFEKFLYEAKNFKTSIEIGENDDYINADDKFGESAAKKKPYLN